MARRRRLADRSAAPALLAVQGKDGRGIQQNGAGGQLLTRARPYSVLASVHAIGSRNGDSSFYSDHTTITVGTAIGVFLVARRLGIVALAIAAMVGIGADRRRGALPERRARRRRRRRDRRGRAVAGSQLWRPFRRGKAHDYAGAIVIIGVDPDGATVPFNDVSGDGQSQAGATG